MEPAKGCRICTRPTVMALGATENGEERHVLLGGDGSHRGKKARQPMPTYRKQSAGKVLRSDAKRLTDGDLLAKLRSFGIELDRPSLERLCRAGALGGRDRHAAARPAHLPRQAAADGKRLDLDLLVGVYGSAGFPTNLRFEALDDKMQAGYELRESGAVAACRIWLEAWSDVLRISGQGGHAVDSGVR